MQDLFILTDGLAGGLWMGCPRYYEVGYRVL